MAMTIMHFRLPDHIQMALKELAKSSDVSVTSLVRNFLEKELQVNAGTSAKAMPQSQLNEKHAVAPKLNDLPDFLQPVIEENPFKEERIKPPKVDVLAAVGLLLDLPKAQRSTVLAMAEIMLGMVESQRRTVVAMIAAYEQEERAA